MTGDMYCKIAIWNCCHNFKLWQADYTMILFQYYNYFYQTALIGNITKAAKALYISQPALSKAISQLETRMGCKLFKRTNKGVSLTIEGKLLFIGIKEIFSILSETQNKIAEIKQDKVSELRIGVGRDVFESYLLPRLKTYYQDAPFARFRIEMLSSELIASELIENRLDIGIMTQQVVHEFIVSKKLFSISECFITGEKYRYLVETGSHSIYELINYYPLLTLPRSSLTRKRMDLFLAEYGLVAAPIHEIQDTKLIAQMVEANFGIGLVTENFIQDDLESGKVYKIPVIEKFPVRDVTLAWSRKIPLSDHVKDFLGYVS